MKKKFEIKNIFNTFALAFTTLALMLGVLLTNTLPQVKAEEPSTPDYSTWEKTALQQGDTVYGKYLLFDNDKYTLELVVPSSIDEDFNCRLFVEAPDSGSPWLNLDLRSSDLPTCDFISSSVKAVIIDDVSYWLVNITDSSVVADMSEIYPGEYNGHSSWDMNLSEATVLADFDGVNVLVEPTVEPDEPTVEPDEPTVEPDEPTVEPDEPTDDNTQQDNSSNVEDKDNFVEMVGNTSIVVFGLENISAFTAGIATLGSIALFIIISVVVIAIIAVSKK
ncbi:MAG: hypothetical protein IKA54_01180 [Clostridia bacterium]|nr:hypothetical protein [Clostridia bacterium]